MIKKDKYLFKCTSIAFFIEIISQQGVSQYPNTNVHATTQNKERAAVIPAYTKLKKISLAISEVCEPLHKLISVKANWTWNKTYKDLHKKARDAHMMLYNALYLKTNTFGIGLDASLLRVRDSMNCRYDEIPDYALS